MTHDEATALRKILIRADPRPPDVLAAHHGHHGNGQSLDNRKANLAWATVSTNTSLRLKRNQIPTLDQILARLLAGLPGRDHDIPFEGAEAA